jgi:hypothetical protein
LMNERSRIRQRPVSLRKWYDKGMKSGMTIAVVLAGFSLIVLLCCAGCTAPVSEETISVEVIDERPMSNYALYTIKVTNDGYVAVSGLKLNVTVVDGPTNSPRTIGSKIVEVGRIEPGESTTVAAEFSNMKLGGDDVRVLVEIV